MEFVSAPRTRKHSRRIRLGWLWVAERAGDLRRRLDDSHRWPGRWGGRIALLRPFETFSLWVFFWTALVGVCVYFAFEEPLGDPWDWLAKWGLGGAFAALVAVLWHDALKSPHTARRVRRRIIAEPAALLRTTLAPQTTKIVELDPPLDTVPRAALYDELLPGALARKKDVQIIVGDPGAGKTTALLDLAAILAKIGFVPVLLELRGECAGEDLSTLAERRFAQQIRPYVRTGADIDIVWRWLFRRKRLAILVDDIDQIGFEGEPGFVMRRLLEGVATEGQAVIVTARPAGVPVGIAASAINIDPLDFETAIDLVARPSMREPGATVSTDPPRGRIERWVRGGDLTEAPLYLEALAELSSVGSCPDLPDDPKVWGAKERPGRWLERAEQRREWNPLWVRYMLLGHFYEGIASGEVRRSLAIDTYDRRHGIEALEGAALGALGASGIGASAAARHADQPEQTREGRPKRTTLVEFISTDDRAVAAGESDRAAPDRRGGVSQHEAIDTGERLRILERDWRGDPQFRHRIMQAFLAGRCLAKLGREENVARGDAAFDADAARAATVDADAPVDCFDAWVRTLMDHHHPEKLTAHLALTFAAIHADERSLHEPDGRWRGLSRWIVERLAEQRDSEAATAGKATANGYQTAIAKLLDPRHAPDPHDRSDPDDELIRLTTAANIVRLISSPPDSSEDEQEEAQSELITTSLKSNRRAIRWTKLQAIPAIGGLGGDEAWRVLWKRFTSDHDYDVRRAASKQLERNARHAYPALGDRIEEQILRAGRGQPPGSLDSDPEGEKASFTALGWVLPAIVSGLSEELRIEQGARPEAGSNGAGPSPENSPPAAAAAQLNTHESCLLHARARLADFTTLAFSGGCPELEESLAQGFKADAMRHASDPAKTFTGPGWVAGNRRLVADIGLPHAESWYARMLLYQALTLYAIAGTSRDDTLDMLTYRLHATRERHPLARRAAVLARTALRQAELKRGRWEAFIWSDDVEDAGRLPSALDRGAAQLVGDVAILVDLKEGSPDDRHLNFCHMEELPHCLSTSPNRHEILGAGCPSHCGWGFCPYRAASPDEPDEHRGLSRGFTRGQRRIALRLRSPSWQRSIGKRRMRDFWEQMEYKARR